MYMNAVADSWSAVGLKGLSHSERAVRSFHGLFSMCAIYGERLLVPGSLGISGCISGADSKQSGLVCNSLVAMMSNSSQHAAMTSVLQLTRELDMFDDRCILSIDIESLFSYLVRATGYKPDPVTAEGTMKNVDTALLIPSMDDCIHAVPQSRKRKYAGDDAGRRAYEVQNDGSNLDKLAESCKALLAQWLARMEKEAKGSQKAIRHMHKILTEAPGKEF